MTKLYNSTQKASLFAWLQSHKEKDDVESYFQYEMTNYPMSLYKDHMMRKPDKASLRKVVLPEKNETSKKDFKGMHVLDGGIFTLSDFSNQIYRHFQIHNQISFLSIINFYLSVFILISVFVELLFCSVCGPS